jgi:hypothetical protein
MQRIAVESSNVASIGFEDTTMEVEFTNGGVYQYFNVDEAVFQGMLVSNSKGKFLNNHIKDKYLFRKVK